MARPPIKGSRRRHQSKDESEGKNEVVEDAEIRRQGATESGGSASSADEESGSAGEVEGATYSASLSRFRELLESIAGRFKKDLPERFRDGASPTLPEEAVMTGLDTVLHARNHSFVLYLAHLVIYLALRTTANDDAGEDEQRTLMSSVCSLLRRDVRALETVLPMETVLQQEVERLERRARLPEGSELLHHPRLEDFKTGGGRSELATSNVMERGKELSGAYMPPRIESVTVEHERVRRKKERQISRVSKSALVADLRAEFGEQPLEQSALGDVGEVRRDVGFAKELDEIERYEEEHLVRLPRGKEQRKAERVLAQQSVVGQEPLVPRGDFAELMRGVVGDGEEQQGDDPLSGRMDGGEPVSFGSKRRRNLHGRKSGGDNFVGKKRRRTRS